MCVCVCARPQKKENKKKLHSIRQFYARTHISEDVIFSFFLYSFDLIHSRLCNIGFVSVAIGSAMR